MTDEFKFNIGDTAVAKILELREQEPGEKDYALFLQIDGVQGNQYTYDLSFLDLEQARPDDKRIEFGELSVVIASKDVDNFNGASLDMSDDPDAPGLTMDNPNTPSPAMFGNPEDGGAPSPPLIPSPGARLDNSPDTTPAGSPQIGRAHV